MIKRALIAGFVVLVGCFLFDYTTNDSVYADPLESAFIGLLVYGVATLVMMVINAISAAIYLFWFGGKDAEGAFLDELRACNVLPPARDDRKTLDYLADLANDGSMDADERVKAATLYATFATVLSKAGLFGGLTLRRAADDAILRYYRESPER